MLSMFSIGAIFLYSLIGHSFGSLEAPSLCEEEEEKNVCKIDV